jgi:hypothetical protein
VPGVGGDVGSDEGGIFQDVPTAGSGLSIGGGRAGNSAILADGASATSAGIGRATVTFSPETVQEVRIITSTFSAKYGVSGGGIIETVSRAGTDRFRGTGYWYHRNPALHAQQFNRPLPPRNRRHEFGLTGSGPLIIPKIYNGKGKTWFFGAIEPKWYFDEIDIYQRFPTEAERRGDFRNSWTPPGQQRPLLYQQVVCMPSPQDCKQFMPMHRNSSTAQYPLFSASDPDPSKRGLVIPPNMIDPLAKKILDEVPLPNQPYDAQGRNYFGTRGVDGNSNRYTLKIDHNVTPRNRVSGTYREIPTLADRFRVRKNDLFFSYPSDLSVTRQALASYSATISPRVVNEFRAAYTYSDYSRLPPGDLAYTNYTRDKFDLPSQTDWGYPRFNSTWGEFGFAGSTLIGNYIEHQYQFSDDISIIKGKHNIGIGFDGRLMMLNVKSSGLREMCCGTYGFNAAQTNSGNTNTPGGTGGWGFAGFLLGLPNSVALRGVVVPYYYRWKVAAAYFQDDYKIKPNLTLNMGVRWQYNGPRWEKFNRQASVDVANPVELTNPDGSPRGFAFNYLFSGFGGRSRYVEPQFLNTFEPRFGFAWSPRIDFLGRRRMVIRGGYGFSHPPTTGRGRDPIPDFGVGSAGAWGFLRWQNNNPPARTQGRDPNYVISIGRNQPVVQVNPAVLELPPDGVLCRGCERTLDPRIPAGALLTFAGDADAPYVQTWSVTTQLEMPAEFVLTVGYLGQRGTHLFSPLLGVNHPDRILYEQLLEEGGDPNELVEDPLGRLDPLGNPLQVPRVDLLRPIPEAGEINIAGLTSANSIYHAGTLSVERRFSAGISTRVNYTWSKTIDTSSDGALNGPNLYLWGNTRVQDAHDLKANRSVSLFDTRHRFNYSFIYELPFGRGKQFFGSARGWRDMIAGGWTTNFLGTIVTGMPFAPWLNDANGIPGGATGTERIRPDIIPGVPLINPRWSKNVANDVPYFNPEAFGRPGFGITGSAPRTLDYARLPTRYTMNVSVFKEIYPFENRRRYVQLRAEAYNALNMVTFTTSPGTNESPNLFNTAPPVTRTGMSLAGPMPYLVNLTDTSGLSPRDRVIAQHYNQNFGKLWRDRNGPGRIIQIGLRFYF